MNAQDVINGRLYTRNLVARYRPHRALSPAEAIVLDRYRSAVADHFVLDLGCGTGRLAAHLLGLTPHYVGVDRSRYMVEYCRVQFPNARFVIRDMRALEFREGAFQAVFAIANLLDAVSHEDRLRVLAEVHRMLAPGGLLVFSSHNRRWSSIGVGPRLELGGSAIARLRHVVEFAIAHLNRRRIRPLEHATDDYALHNDSAHNHAVLHYYIDRASQARQLASSGFTLIETLDERGRSLTPEDDDTVTASLVYIARR